MAKEFITKQILLDVGLGPNGKLKKFMGATIAKHMDKWVPFREGTLARTVIQNGQPTSNVTDETITYEQEYASYVYKGVSKLGKPMRYNRSIHRGAGPYWDLRMMTAEKSKIIREIQNEVDRGV